MGGFIIDGDGKAEMAPIFDNGNSLFPNVDLSAELTLEFVHTRVYKMPGSQFRRWRDGIDDRPMRTNYWEVINDFKDIDILREKIDYAAKQDIESMIAESVIDVPENIARWFQIIIYCRFNCLIKSRDFMKCIRRL